MARFERIAWALIFLLLIWGCGKKSPNGPDKPMNEPEKVAFTATKPAAEQDLAALQDALPQNISITLSDLLGRELPTGDVSISYFYVVADTVWQLNQYQGPSNATKFYGAAFPGDFDANGTADFADFYKFADVFGRKLGQTGYDRLFDFDGDGQVSWQDFFIFADFFGSVADGAQISSAKPAILPAQPPAEGLGQMTYADLLKAWPSLTRAAKTMAVNRQYQFRIQSLDKAFADTTVNVNGEIFGNRHFTFSVNAAPALSLAPGIRDTMIFGDTLRVVMSRFFTTDDTLKFSVESPLQPWVLTWAIASDSIVIITPTSVGRDVVVFRATDTAGQSQTYELGVEVRERPVPSDTTLPTGSLEVANSTAYITAWDVKDSVQVVLTAGADTLLSGWFDPLDKSVGLNLPEFSTTTIRLAITDKAGNGPVVYEATVKVGDITPPQGAVSYEWVGDRKNQLAVNVSLSDNTGLGDHRVFAGTLDYSSNGNGRQNLNFSPSDASFPTVTSVTTREIKLHVCDQAGNCVDSSTLVDQPISPQSPLAPVVNNPPSSGGGGGTTTPPPAADVAPTLSATVNGQTGTIQVTAGTALTFSATATGTPTPIITWTFAGQTVQSGWAAVSGTLTVTATNSAGSASQTFNISALGGAP